MKYLSKSSLRLKDLPSQKVESCKHWDVFYGTFAVWMIFTAGCPDCLPRSRLESQILVLALLRKLKEVFEVADEYLTLMLYFTTHIWNIVVCVCIVMPEEQNDTTINPLHTHRLGPSYTFNPTSKKHKYIIESCKVVDVLVGSVLCFLPLYFGCIS